MASNERHCGYDRINNPLEPKERPIGMVLLREMECVYKTLFSIFISIAQVNWAKNWIHLVFLNIRPKKKNWFFLEGISSFNSLPNISIIFFNPMHFFLRRNKILHFNSNLNIRRKRNFPFSYHDCDVYCVI